MSTISTLLVFIFLSLIFETLFSPTISSITKDLYCFTSLSFSLSTRILDALYSSLLCASETDLANLFRYIASSRAVLPPPTTITFLSLKNPPSQTAQYETPRPVNSFSPFTPKYVGVVPVAMITAFAEYSSPSISNLLSVPFKFNFSIFP